MDEPRSPFLGQASPATGKGGLDAGRRSAAVHPAQRRGPRRRCAGTGSRPGRNHTAGADRKPPRPPWGPPEASAAALGPTGFYRFSLGHLTVTVLSYGSFQLPSRVFAAEVDEVTRDAYYRSPLIPADQVALQVSPVLLESGGRRILVDAGMASGAERMPGAPPSAVNSPPERAVMMVMPVTGAVATVGFTAAAGGPPAARRPARWDPVCHILPRPLPSRAGSALHRAWCSSIGRDGRDRSRAPEGQGRGRRPTIR
jgi:hypothetical protein